MDPSYKRIHGRVFYQHGLTWAIGSSFLGPGFIKSTLQYCFNYKKERCTIQHVNYYTEGAKSVKDSEV